MIIPIDNENSLSILEPKDAPTLFKTIVTNRMHLRASTPWVDQIKSEKDALHLIEEGLIEMNAQKSLKMGIFGQEGMKGYIEMQEWDHHLKKAIIGYWIVKEEEGKGLMFASSKVFLKYLFEELKLNKVELTHLTDNSRSAVLAKRLAFTVEGILRDHIILNGSFKDLVVQGLLQKEFKQIS